MSDKTARPVATLRRGNIKAAIWQNAGKDGIVRYNTTIRDSKDNSPFRRFPFFDGLHSIVRRCFYAAGIAWRLGHALRTTQRQATAAGSGHTSPSTAPILFGRLMASQFISV